MTQRPRASTVWSIAWAHCIHVQDEERRRQTVVRCLLWRRRARLIGVTDNSSIDYSICQPVTVSHCMHPTQLNFIDERVKNNHGHLYTRCNVCQTFKSIYVFLAGPAQGRKQAGFWMHQRIKWPLILHNANDRYYQYYMPFALLDYMRY